MNTPEKPDGETVKVMLLNPPSFEGVRFVREGRCEQRVSSFQYNMVPISLLSSAAVLRDRGHSVRIVDAIASNTTAEDTVREAKAFSPDLILVNTATPTFINDVEVARLLKEALPRCFVAAFGVHVTALAEESLKSSRLDGAIRREPEITAADLARTLQKGEGLEGVRGLSFRESWRNFEDPGKIVHNADRPFCKDLDSLPMPAFDLVDHRLYPAPLSGEPHTLIVTSRGCPHLCTYCSAHLYYGSRLRLRDPMLIVREISQVHRQHGLKLFTFWSDTFTLDREFVTAICEELLKLDLEIEWMCNSRVDRVDPDLLRLMTRAGCRIISYGVESGDQGILDRVKKGIKVQQIVSAFDWTRQAGLKSAAHIIFGLPGETPETIRKTLRLVRRIRPDYVQFYGAIPFPGTEFYRQALDEGWLTADSWEDFEINNNIVSTPQLSAAELGRWRRRAYASFYLRPGYLLSRLAEVQSTRDILNLYRAGWDFLRNWVFSHRVR